MNIVIFGFKGQDGSYLNESALRRGFSVTGVARQEGDIIGHVGNFEFVDSLLAEKKPSYIFHLAANSTTRHDALFENHATISTGTLNILEAVHKHCPACKVFITGSGLQFINRGQPISERDEFSATSAYSVARIHTAYAARYYRTLGIRAYVGYLFHHDSPRRTENHVSAMVAAAARRIAAGDTAPLIVGDMSVRKEWGHARDIVEGIWALVNQDDIFEATIGTGVDYSIQDWIETCFSTVGLDWREFVRPREGFKAEYTRLVSDPATLFSLGWRPKESLESLAKEMLGLTHHE
jgi:GDPmannose 4,6-dehydratase